MIVTICCRTERETGFISCGSKRLD